MTATADDKRAAVALSVTLSGQLIQAAVTFLTIEGAYVTFILGSRDIDGWFLVFAILAAIFLILSIFVAGKAVTAARNEGFVGNWTQTAGKNLFNFQAILLVISITFFGLMFPFIGKPKDSTLEKQISNLTEKLDSTKSELKNLTVKYEADKQVTEKKIANASLTLNQKTDELEADLKKMNDLFDKKMNQNYKSKNL